jgi:YesN/AraC family two-component response regulator
MLFCHGGILMIVVNEKILYENPLLSLKIFKSQRGKNEIGGWHYHKELEILLVLDGSLEVHVEEEVYAMESGSVVLIGASQLHRDRTYERSDLKYMVLQFDIQQFFDQSTVPYIKYFSETKRPFSHLNYIFQDNSAAQSEVFNSIQEIYLESQQKTEGYEIAVTMHIKKIMLTLLRNDTRQVLDYNTDHELLRLKPVIHYIEEHISEKIHIEEASKLVNMSYYYFVKYFKRVMGMTFTEYVNYKKIKKAERVLLTKEIKVSYVGEAIGLPNMAHFYKLFRKYNACSPNEFRKKMQAWNKKIELR